MRKSGKVDTNPKGHLLYVEDHDDTRILMSMMLERAGFTVTSATNGTEAMKLVDGGHRFDLYLLNHTFPDASGISLCKMIRRIDAHTPILFYSGRAMKEEKEAAIKAGANDYLIKPNDIFNVTEHVAKWIEESKQGGQ